jgi:predicted nucleotidyltransferase
VYVVGSVALNDWHAGSSDIDIIAITTEPADEEMAGALLTAHAVFAERCPRPTVDGPFLAWGDLTLSPQGVTRPWTLDGQFHHDAECFELNPVTWYTLATYGVRVRGPEPVDLEIPLDNDALVRFVIDNSRNYWRLIHEQFTAAVGELRDSDMLSSSVPVWCLLGACRMLYTATTADVTSKSGAGLWAADTLGDEHRAACEAVVALRAEPEHDVTFELLRASADAMGEAVKRTEQLRS